MKSINDFIRAAMVAQKIGLSIKAEEMTKDELKQAIIEKVKEKLDMKKVDPANLAVNPAASSELSSIDTIEDKKGEVPNDSTSLNIDDIKPTDDQDAKSAEPKDKTATKFANIIGRIIEAETQIEFSKKEWDKYKKDHPATHLRPKITDGDSGSSHDEKPSSPAVGTKPEEKPKGGKPEVKEAPVQEKPKEDKTEIKNFNEKLKTEKPSWHSEESPLNGKDEKALKEKGFEKKKVDLNDSTVLTDVSTGVSYKHSDLPNTVKEQFNKINDAGGVWHAPASTEKTPTPADAPKTEAPKPVEKGDKPTEKIEAPKTETPKPETPKPEAPKTEAPKPTEKGDKPAEGAKPAEKAAPQAPTGGSDYSKVDVATLQKNIKSNLDHFEDKSVEETKNTNKEPVTKENVKEFTSSLKKNTDSVLKKYSKVMSSISKPMLEKHLDHAISAIHEGLEDGSLSDLKQDDVDEFMREECKRYLHQEVETRRRSIGDHGIRHLAQNTFNAMEMLGELKASGTKVTGRDKLMTTVVMTNHDTGYTVGEAAWNAVKGKTHKANSATLATEERGRYEKLFGKEDTDKLIHSIATHDEPEFDWDKDPINSTIRLSDSVALFGQEKVQDLFIRSPKAVKLACKMRLAGAAGDKDLVEDVKKQMKALIDKSDFHDNDKHLLHQQVDEMNEGKFSSTEDILSRFSGRIKGFKFNKAAGVMNINMKYSPEGEVLDGVFGEDLATKQFTKFVKDMSEPYFKEKGIEGEAQLKKFMQQQKKDIGDKKEHTVLTDAHGKPVIAIHVDGIDSDPVESANTSEIKDFAQKTARLTFRHALTKLVPPPYAATDKDVAAAKDVLTKDKDKFSDTEWKKVEDMFTVNKADPSKIIEGLKGFGMLDSEKAYLKSREARVTRIVNKIASKFVTSRMSGLTNKIVQGSIVDRIAMDLIQARKDKDLMSDTGGSSKGRQREPEAKPPRDDLRNNGRERRLTKDQKDSDIHNDPDLKN